jgi:hypothetical protein
MAVARLDYLRELRQLAQTMTARQIGLKLRGGQQQLEADLVEAGQVPDPLEGFCGATPTEVAQRYAAGLIGRDQVIDELDRWPYRAEQWSDGWEPNPAARVEGTVLELAETRSRGLLSAEVYDAIVQRADDRRRSGL